MILGPAALSLLLGSTLSAMLLLLASIFAIRILRHWQPGSGSEGQLSLERSTSLVSTVLRLTVAGGLLMLPLFIHTVDDLHGRFVGAMCAAGTLQVNPYGYVALMTQICFAIFGALWLILDYVDCQGFDYPLIRIKFAAFLALAIISLVAAVLLWIYFSGLQPDVITSCCGSLFSSAAPASDKTSMVPPVMATAWVCGGSLMVLVGSGVLFLATGRGAVLFSLASGVATVGGIAAIISFVSLYYYELPTHHCPFCLLQAEYNRVGYLLYGALFSGGIAGAMPGILVPFRSVMSLHHVVPKLQRRGVWLAFFGFGLFLAAASWQMVTATLTLRG
jgi:hypothetical protein